MGLTNTYIATSKEGKRMSQYDELTLLEELKKSISRLVSSKKTFIKLSEKRSMMSMPTHTERSIDNANAKLNWPAMEHDKIVREVHAIAVDCGIAEPKSDYGSIEYNPSSFQCYTFKPRVPLCRQ